MEITHTYTHTPVSTVTKQHPAQGPQPTCHEENKARWRTWASWAVDPQGHAVTRSTRAMFAQRTEGGTHAATGVRAPQAEGTQPKGKSPRQDRSNGSACSCRDEGRGGANGSGGRCGWTVSASRSHWRVSALMISPSGKSNLHSVLDLRQVLGFCSHMLPL